MHPNRFRNKKRLLAKKPNSREKEMKKVITMLTAVAFILGLAGAGLAQGPAKEAAKPEVKKEMPAAQTQVAPKPEETAKPVTKEEAKPAGPAKPAVKEPVKTGEKEKTKKGTKKDTKKAKNEKKSTPLVEKPKEEKKL